jgi:dienelactone hydrolase
MKTKSLLASLALALCTIAAHAGELIKLPTREGVTANVLWHETPNAKITVLILPGGGGGFGRVENGLPTSGNFLVRTAQTWINEGFNYAVFGKPTDMSELDYPDRISAKHLTDLKATVAFIKTKTNTPIFIVGTSRGTISAAHLLINEPDSAIAGGVLTSSVTAYKKIGAVPSQDLQKIKVPMLVFHHSGDACEICRPHEVPAIVSGLKNAPIKKLMMVSGGSGATGSPCEGQHFHGFIGMEFEAVHAIAEWIRNPSN